MGAGRPALGLGTSGNISTWELDDEQWRAMTRYRDSRTGATRQVTATAATEAAAKRALRAKLAKKQEPDAVGVLTRETTLAELAEVWLDGLEQPEYAIQTVSRYRHTTTRTVIPAIGDLRLREVTRGKLVTLIRDTALDSPSEAKQVRAVLKSMLTLAVQNDAIAENFADRTGLRIKDPGRAPTRALEVSAVHRVFELIDAAASKTKPGPKSRKAHADLRDILRLQLAGGLRLSEAASIQVSDIDWAAEPPTLWIHRAVVYRPPANGQPGCYLLQTHTKKSDERIIPLPAWAAELLRRRSKVATASGLLFHTAKSTPLNLNNVRRTLRASLEGSGLSWASTHTMRRTIGTLVTAELGLPAASSVLGHRHESTTENSYVEKAVRTPDVTSITNQFGTP